MPDASGRSKTKKDPKKLIRRLSAGSAEVRWVIRALKQQVAAAARVRKADLRTEREAVRNRAREAKAAAVKMPSAVIQPAAVALHPKTAEQALKPWRRALEPANAALGGDIRAQLARLRSAERDRDRLQATVGDPTTFLCLFRADSVTATAMPVYTQGTINVIPPTPIAQNSVSARNRVRFAAAASSPFGYLAEMASVLVNTFHVFSFSSTIAAVCTPTVHFEANATYSLNAPDAVYIFPWYHAVPHARLILNLVLRADHWLPGVPATSTPSATFSTIASRPEVFLFRMGRCEVGKRHAPDRPALVPVAPGVRGPAGLARGRYGTV